ncbi:MAG: hypothetical protein Unbinned2514contig1000_26 [Prokaryotic dsDNA virus sp.]|nr:MAG: hypothetical protein Unbinned2514contig1000_26 [Prokaryotic dsDNA virus sp.]|tara:strand:- start:3937 stop:4677 length:741 start_codon:yes stop_codon:yes gene_type:complete
MLFFPFGVTDNDVADPQKIANEFQEANRVASNTTQHQFNANAFEHANMAANSNVIVETASQNVTLQVTNSAGPVLAAASNANLFQIPYAQGLQEIPIDGDSWPHWTSTYPELVFVCFSFQFARAITFSYDIRVQIKLSIDGSIVEGAGPSALQTDAKNPMFGSGIGNPSAASSISTIAILPAGAHRIVPMAAQMSTNTVVPQTTTDDGWFGLQPLVTLDSPPVDEVAIGNRSMIVLRFPRGGALEG